MTRWISVHGVVVRGHRIASGLAKDSPFGDSTIKLQMPLFRERGFDLRSCYPGTLNVSIAPRIRTMLLTEPTLRNVLWHKSHIPENFFLSKCRVQFGGETYESWIYYPDPSTKEQHFQKPSLFEIIAPLIPAIRYDDPVVVDVNPEEVGIT
ncbi:MAG: hypothetical protein Q7S26_03610 [bacterium]|nr:hypothetical protein [bacterium]